MVTLKAKGQAAVTRQTTDSREHVQPCQKRQPIDSRACPARHALPLMVIIARAKRFVKRAANVAALAGRPCAFFAAHSAGPQREVERLLQQVAQLSHQCGCVRSRDRIS